MENITAIKPLGTIDLETMRMKVKEEREKWLTENRVRLEQEYGINEKFSEYELLKIREYEKGKKICEGCEGLPCGKIKDKMLRSTLEINSASGVIYERVGTCRWERARQNEERMEHNFKSAKISSNYLNKDFSDYEVDAENKLAVETVKKILRGEERGAYFYGAFGTGKTFLSAITAKELTKRGKATLFYKVPFLVKDLQDAMFDKSDLFKESSLLKQICEVPVLILDDFGMSGKISTYAAGRLSMIIDARYENDNLVTIITSNLSLRALEEKLNKPSDATDNFTLDGGRITDRLREMCAIVKLGGTSRRSKK